MINNKYKNKNIKSTHNISIKLWNKAYFHNTMLKANDNAFDGTIIVKGKKVIHFHDASTLLTEIRKIALENEKNTLSLIKEEMVNK